MRPQRALLLVVLVAAAACTASTSTAPPSPTSSSAAAATQPASTGSPGAAGAPTGSAGSADATSSGAAAPSSFSSSQFVVALSNCKAPEKPTTESTEGPYYKAGAPEKASLVTDGMAGTRLRLVGLVLTRSCKPVVDAKVDLWQADASGTYDNTGYTLRGFVKTDSNGQYRVETIVPGPYPGRTPHIHVKVTPPGGRTLTTQLYLSNVASNSGDGIFRPDLVMSVSDGPPLTGLFAFIVDQP